LTDRHHFRWKLGGAFKNELCNGGLWHSWGLQFTARPISLRLSSWYIIACVWDGVWVFFDIIYWWFKGRSKHTLASMPVLGPLEDQLVLIPLQYSPQHGPVPVFVRSLYSLHITEVWLWAIFIILELNKKHLLFSTNTIIYYFIEFRISRASFLNEFISTTWCKFAEEGSSENFEEHAKMYCKTL
jgi:hypothetical protein